MSFSLEPEKLLLDMSEREMDRDASSDSETLLRH